MFESGHEPFVPHTQYEWSLEFYPPHVANVVALYLCCKEIERCDEVWTWGDSDGMRYETTYAKGLGIPVRDGEEALRGETGW